MTPADVKKALNALGPDDKVWVAGSAAICPALAEDIDIWILKKSNLLAEKFSSAIWNQVDPTEYQSNVHGISSIREVHIEGGKYWPEQKIQVIHTTHKTIFDLLYSFDVSCHCFARNRHDYFVARPGATLPGQPIKILNGATEYQVNYPSTSKCGGPCSECWPDTPDNNPPEDYVDEGVKPTTTLTKTGKRLQEFTARYANTTPDMLWLPSFWPVTGLHEANTCLG